MERIDQTLIARDELRKAPQHDRILEVKRKVQDLLRLPLPQMQVPALRDWTLALFAVEIAEGLLRKKNAERSAKLLKWAIDRLHIYFPDEDILPHAYGLFAQAQRVRHEFVEALRYAEKAVERRPFGFVELQQLGVTHFELGDYEEAEKHLRTSFALSDHEEAEKHLSTSFASDPADFQLQTLNYIRGTLFARTAMLTNRDDRKYWVERIIESLHQALPLVQAETKYIRRYLYIHYWLGRFHSELMNYDRSDYHLKLAKSAGFYPFECCFYLGVSCIEQELFDRAEEYLREALHEAFQDCKKDSESRVSLMSWARDKDKTPTSHGIIYHILYTCLLLALVFAERGRDKARVERWLRFVARHRDFLRRPTSAAQWDDQRRLEKHRRDIEACYEDYRGWVYYLDGQPSKARDHIEAAVKLNANAEWLYHLARVCLALAATNESPGTDWLERARECCARARNVDLRGAFTRRLADIEADALARGAHVDPAAPGSPEVAVPIVTTWLRKWF